MHTVLITGCSTGFGRETALKFLDKGWNVVATMRHPSASTLPNAGHLRVLPLDVTESSSIAAAVSAAGPVDVLINNAGIGWLNAIEGTPMQTARRIFDANLFGAVEMMQAVLPGMRERGSGAIVNVGSSSTYKPLPLLSLYRASKAALNALTNPLIWSWQGSASAPASSCPGRAPSTAFADSARSQIMGSGGFPEPYAAFANEVMTTMVVAADEPLTTARDVAEAVYRAATDPDCPMMLPAGPDAVAWAAAS